MMRWFTAQELSEKQIAGPCLDVLKLRGWYAVRVLCGRFWTLDKRRVVSGPPKGTPDYLCVHPEHPGFFLETKRPRGKLGAEQIFQIRAIQQGYRVACIIIDSPHQLTEFLARWEKGEWAATELTATALKQNAKKSQSKAIIHKVL